MPRSLFVVADARILWTMRASIIHGATPLRSSEFLWGKLGKKFLRKSRMGIADPMFALLSACSKRLWSEGTTSVLYSCQLEILARKGEQKSGVGAEKGSTIKDMVGEETTHMVRGRGRGFYL